MATVTHTPMTLPTWVDFDKVRVRQWKNMHNGDVGDNIALASFSDKTVQVSGTFGVGGTVVLEGTVNGTDFVELADVFNAPLSATAARIFTITEVPMYMRPRVTGGDGTTDITVSILVR